MGLFLFPADLDEARGKAIDVTPKYVPADGDGTRFERTAIATAV
jgi:hypothetical protein